MSAAVVSRIGLPLSQRLGRGQQGEVVFHHLRDAVQHQGSLGGAGPAPGVLGGVGGVQGPVNVGGVRPGDLAEDGR